MDGPSVRRRKEKQNLKKENPLYLKEDDRDEENASQNDEVPLCS